MTINISDEERARRIGFVIMDGSHPESDVEKAAGMAIDLIARVGGDAGERHVLAARLRADISSDHLQGKHRPDSFAACVDCREDVDPGEVDAQ